MIEFLDRAQANKDPIVGHLSVHGVVVSYLDQEFKDRVKPLLDSGEFICGPGMEFVWY